jgi:hypothetical protein
MCSHDNRHLVLNMGCNMGLSEEGGEDLLNPMAMRGKGGKGVIPVCAKVGPQGMVRNTAPDTVAIDDGEKPDHPPAGIIGFSRREFDLHARLPFTMHLPQA